jgi:hypothetical protein
MLPAGLSRMIVARPFGGSPGRTLYEHGVR